MTSRSYRRISHRVVTSFPPEYLNITQKLEQDLSTAITNAIKETLVANGYPLALVQVDGGMRDF